jgi:hypothetical protein
MLPLKAFAPPFPLRAMLALGLIAGGSPLAAQSRTGDALLDGIVTCRGEKDDAERLKCFDRAARALADARADDGLAVLSRDEVREKRRSLFGLALPDINLFGKTDDKIPRIDTLESTVTRVTASGRNKVTVYLADNSIWRTVELAKVNPKSGDTVRIKRGAIGSYLGSFGGARSISILRVR